MSLLNRELDYFLAICETRNLARAADVLGISQPALTRSLQRLEAQLGAQLFVRAPRGVELTPIGAALRARANSARVTLHDAEREVAQLAAGKVGKVRIGAGHVVARMVSQSLLPRFIVERPTAQIQFHVAFNAELFGLLETGSLDFAVCGLLETPPHLRFRELLSTELVVIVRAGHPLTKLRNPSVRDLSGYRSAAPSTGVPARQMVERVLAKFGLGGTGPTRSRRTRGRPSSRPSAPPTCSASRRATRPCATAGRRAWRPSASRNSTSVRGRAS